MDLVKSPQVPAQLAARYEGEAGRYWDLFYRRNKERFFKDRHYFGQEFPQLLGAGAILEVGCGAGNSVFPLLELNPRATLYACDFAPSAVEVVCSHPAYEAAAATLRLHAFVADITADDLTAHVPAGSVDACTMVFVLSAIAPAAWPRALRRVAATLRPGGSLLFRDYAAGDLAQARLAAQGRQQRLADNFYVRWDGTCAYYFTPDIVRGLFEGEGFRCEYVRVDERVHENRAREERMDRRFLQAVFTFVGSSSSGSSDAGGGSDDKREAGAISEAAPGRADAAGPQGSMPGGQQQPERPDEALQETSLRLGGGLAAALPLQLRCRQQAACGSAAAADRAAAQALAELVLRCPATFCGASILELCCWDAPLAALAALRWCRRAVAAGASEAHLQLLRRNVRRNSHQVVIERLRLTQLDWRSGNGGEQQERWAALLQAMPAGFQSVLAAVPVASTAADLRRLLGGAAMVLAREPAARLLLCLPGSSALLGAVSAQAAAAAGLQEDSAPPPEVAAACRSTESMHPIRFVCLQRHL